MGPPTGEYRIVRGGYWFFPAAKARSASRARRTPDMESESIGFRVVRSVVKAHDDDTHP